MPTWNDWCFAQERGTRFGFVESHRLAVRVQVRTILGRLHMLFDISGVRASFKNLEIVPSLVQRLPKLSVLYERSFNLISASTTDHNALIRLAL